MWADIRTVYAVEPRNKTGHLLFFQIFRVCWQILAPRFSIPVISFDSRAVLRKFGVVHDPASSTRSAPSSKMFPPAPSFTIHSHFSQETHFAERDISTVQDNVNSSVTHATSSWVRAGTALRVVGFQAQGAPALRHDTHARITANALDGQFSLLFVHTAKGPSQPRVTVFTHDPLGDKAVRRRGQESSRLCTHH